MFAHEKPMVIATTGPIRKQILARFCRGGRLSMGERQ